MVSNIPNGGQQEPHYVTLGGVKFNDNTVAQYGKDNDTYFINFKNGTRIEYPEQTRNATITDHYDNRWPTLSPMEFERFDGATIFDGKLNDVYQISNSTNVGVNTQHEISRSYYSSQFNGTMTDRDNDSVYIDGVYVEKNGQRDENGNWVI